jgi:hypothetical protein
MSCQMLPRAMTGALQTRESRCRGRSQQSGLASTKGSWESAQLGGLICSVASTSSAGEVPCCSSCLFRARFCTFGVFSSNPAFFFCLFAPALAAESPGKPAPQPRPRFVLSAYGKLLIFETPTAPSVRRTMTLYAPPPLQALNPNPYRVQSSTFPPAARAPL